jgi:hypothetical protein
MEQDAKLQIIHNVLNKRGVIAAKIKMKPTLEIEIIDETCREEVLAWCKEKVPEMCVVINAKNLTGKRFNIQSSNYSRSKLSIPWEFAKQYEKEIQNNHGQTLEELDRRGGLSELEMLTAIDGDRLVSSKWKFIHPDQALEKLNQLVKDWAVKRNET